MVTEDHAVPDASWVTECVAAYRSTGADLLAGPVANGATRTRADWANYSSASGVGSAADGDARRPLSHAGERRPRRRSSPRACTPPTDPEPARARHRAELVRGGTHAPRPAHGSDAHPAPPRVEARPSTTSRMPATRVCTPTLEDRGSRSRHRRRTCEPALPQEYRSSRGVSPGSPRTPSPGQVVAAGTGADHCRRPRLGRPVGPRRQRQHLE